VRDFPSIEEKENLQVRIVAVKFTRVNTYGTYLVESSEHIRRNFRDQIISAILWILELDLVWRTRIDLQLTLQIDEELVETLDDIGSRFGSFANFPGWINGLIPGDETIEYYTSSQNIRPISHAGSKCDLRCITFLSRVELLLLLGMRRTRHS
jgi:hypothetical protein